jgi:hypothetical protein
MEDRIVNLKVEEISKFFGRANALDAKVKLIEVNRDAELVVSVSCKAETIAINILIEALLTKRITINGLLGF